MPTKYTQEEINAAIEETKQLLNKYCDTAKEALTPEKIAALSETRMMLCALEFMQDAQLMPGIILTLTYIHLRSPIEPITSTSGE